MRSFFPSGFNTEKLSSRKSKIRLPGIASSAGLSLGVVCFGSSPRTEANAAKPTATDTTANAHHFSSSDVA